jgi:hypothetical protein
MGEDTLSIGVWWKDWVETTDDSPATPQDEREPLDEGDACDFERWKRQGVSEFASCVAEKFERKVSRSAASS